MPNTTDSPSSVELQFKSDSGHTVKVVTGRLTHNTTIFIDDKILGRVQDIRYHASVTGNGLNELSIVLGPLSEMTWDLTQGTWTSRPAAEWSTLRDERAQAIKALQECGFTVTVEEIT